MRVCACVCVSACVRVHVCVCVSMWACARVCVSMYACVQKCLHVRFNWDDGDHGWLVGIYFHSSVLICLFRSRQPVFCAGIYDRRHENVNY